jgi:heat shock protein HslJ
MTWKILINSLLNLVIVLFGCNQPARLTATTVKTNSSIMRNSGDSINKKYEKQNEMLTSGIDFTASGNEPFWSLEIDFNKYILFKTPGGLEITTHVPEGVKAMDANVTGYAAQTEWGVLNMQIAKQECINDMSGKKSDYKVLINVKSKTDKDYKTYKGCGQYLSDYRLHDIWVLERINDKQLKSSDFMKGLPNLELNLTEKKVFGHSGCNTLNGSLEVQGKKIYFGRMVTIGMACTNMDFENSYLNGLSGRTVDYKIEPGKLYLRISNDSMFIYRKVD